MNENRQSWLERDPNEERHKGSYDFEELKQTEEYGRRIEQVDAIKRKYAICFGYLGSNYQGLQINPGALTIERELEKAIFLCGGIQECNFGYMHKFQFTRAARTDRGVHAITQCCAMKLLAPLDKRTQFIEQLNTFLPADIRAITMTKVSKGFNAKSHCTKRRYHYLLPTYALQPHADLTALLQEQFNQQGPVPGAGCEGGYIEEFSKRGVGRVGLEQVYAKVKSHRVTPDAIGRLRVALKSYEGTKAYHNFTTGKLPSDANAKRFIISFECGEAFVDEASGVEWVLLSVLGQSFLLNQIRKMVGMAVEVCRGATPLSTIQDAFTTRKMDLPMAPSLGLYLGELFFDGYNAKQRKEMANDKRLAALRAEKKAAAAATPTVATSTDSAEACDGEGDGDEIAAKKARLNPPGEASMGSNVVVNNNDDEGQSHEVIDWSSNQDTSKAMAAFRDEVIHPHIFQQDAKSLDFLYYFDFLRAYPRDYAAMTSAFNSSGGSTSGTIGASGASAGNGKPPVVRVTTAAASVSIPASSTPASAREIAEKMV